MSAVGVASESERASGETRPLAQWHARPVGELTLTRQQVYARALALDFPAGVRLRPWLCVTGGSEPAWRRFARGASETEIAWALTALDALTPRAASWEW